MLQVGYVFPGHPNRSNSLLTPHPSSVEPLPGVSPLLPLSFSLPMIPQERAPGPPRPQASLPLNTQAVCTCLRLQPEVQSPIAVNYGISLLRTVTSLFSGAQTSFIPQFQALLGILLASQGLTSTGQANSSGGMLWETFRSSLGLAFTSRDAFRPGLTVVLGQTKCKGTT